MPPTSQSSNAAAAADEADSVREHARNMVKMADMTIKSTEKVERKAVEGDYDESAVDFLLGGSDASNLDLSQAEDASADKEGTATSGSDGKGGGGTTTRKSGSGDGDGVEYGTVDEDEELDGTAPPSTSPSSRRSSKKATQRRSSKKKEKATTLVTSGRSSPISPNSAAGSAGGGDGDDATTATDSMLSLGGLSTANAPISDNASAETLREQLSQTRRALLQVRENAKLKHRKLELEHTTVKKELKKAKDVIEKQTVEYKKLKVRLEGVQKECDDAREELTRELGGRGSLVSGISQENGRMIRRLREIRAERDKLEAERDDMKHALELCTCKAGEGHQFTLASSLAHETVPINQASALSQRHFTTESRQNIFESARSIRSNLSGEMTHEIEATKAEMAMETKRRNSTSGGSVMFRNPTRRHGHRSYHRSAEEKNGHPEYDYDDDDYDDDDQSVMSYISMSVRSLPATTKKKIDHVWSSTSMRLGNELDPDHSSPGERLTVEFRNKRRSRGRRSYQRHGAGMGGEAGETNIAPKAVPPIPESSDSAKSFWAATSQRFLMGMAKEMDEL
mmetsp:Transcript_3218/g.9234  ORF Transcript_3218/g.9234 Transcript_3218/m.9234 type:complete len:567 (+) Transcript_3218:188-1888(+)